VRYGRSVEDGFLPVMSVDTEEEAHTLLVFTCSKSAKGEFIARELQEEQTLDNLEKFSARLADAYEITKARKRKRKAKRS